MKCKYCGKPLSVDSKHCLNCDSPYRAGVREQVFEVIVRQALAGAPWQTLCAGPMEVNSITVAEVEEEIKRRGGGNEHSAPVPRKPIRPDGSASIALPLPDPESTEQ